MIIAGWGWVLWALITYPIAEFLIENQFYLLSVIAWALLYIALTDILPEFKWKWTVAKKLAYFAFIILWIISFLGYNTIIDNEHSHGDSHGSENHDEEDHDEEDHDDEIQ